MSIVKLFAAVALALQVLLVAAAPVVTHGRLDVDGVSVFYREAGDPVRPTLVLLHGFPASSQMYAGLIEDLADRYHVVAPDYPGAGHTTVAEGAKFEPTFDGVTDVIERFIERKGVRRYALYMQDFGGPVGFRLAQRRPAAITALVLQNANIYEEGLSAKLRDNIALMAEGVNERTLPAFELVLSPASVQFMFTAGSRRPEALDPDNRALADAGLRAPFNREVQMRLLADYRSNVERYPAWQRYLREHKPATLVVWGRNDPLFTSAGATAVRRDLPTAEVHLLDTGHFALQEDRAAIAARVGDFLQRQLR